MTAKLPRLAFLAALLGFALLGAQSECQSEAELWRLASSSQDRGTVQWTPDGSKIIFSGGGKIVVADASGTEFYTIPQGPAANPPFLQDGPARISPDGSKLAYVTYRYLKGISRTHSDEIATSNLDGSDPRRLTSNHYDYHQPAWSPDGSQIAFASNSYRAKKDDRYGIFVVNSDGNSDRRLIGPPKEPGLANKYSWSVSSPVWSPNGEFIVFLESVRTDDWHRYIAAIKPDGSGYHRIYEISPAGSYFTVPPRFSPDGSRLVFAAYENDSSVIKTIHFDGSNQRTLLNIPTTDAMRTWLSPRTTGTFQSIDHIAWSPDGSEIFFVGFLESSDDPQSLGTGLHAIGLDDTGSTPNNFGIQRVQTHMASGPITGRLPLRRAPNPLRPGAFNDWRGQTPRRRMVSQALRRRRGRHPIHHSPATALDRPTLVQWTGWLPLRRAPNPLRPGAFNDWRGQTPRRRMVSQALRRRRGRHPIHHSGGRVRQTRVDNGDRRGVYPTTPQPEGGTGRPCHMFNGKGNTEAGKASRVGPGLRNSLGNTGRPDRRRRIPQLESRTLHGRMAGNINWRLAIASGESRPNPYRR